MSIFKIKRTAEAVKENTGGSFSRIKASGIYDVTIKIASMKVNSFNAREIDFNLEYDGNTTTLYGLKLDNNDGTEHYQAEVFNKLCIIADLEEVAAPEMETHKFGDISKDLAVLPDFTDLVVKVRVQQEYSKYKDEIKSRLLIKNFYRADGATAAEILEDVAPDKIGGQLEKDIAYSVKPSYKDGLTEEDAVKWEAEQVAQNAAARAGKAAGGAPKMESTAPASNLFARKA